MPTTEENISVEELNDAYRAAARGPLPLDVDFDVFEYARVSHGCDEGAYVEAYFELAPIDADADDQQAHVAAATEQFGKDGEVEFDADAEVEHTSEASLVQGWVWVRADDLPTHLQEFARAYWE